MDVPEKRRVFSDMIPGVLSSYVYGPNDQEAYHQQYRESRFAITKRKGGWDCLRHYEILAAGCIPVFEQLEECPPNTMTTFPKELVLRAARELLPWQDTQAFRDRYAEYVRQLLLHCRSHCSISALTLLFLQQLPVQPKSILMLTCDPGVNYTRELLSIGLRRLFGLKFIDYPKNEVLYTTCDLSNEVGYGFSYGGRLEDLQIDRIQIEERIRAHEFDLILYGKIGRDESDFGSLPKMPFLKAVQSTYSNAEIALLYGGDGCQKLNDRRSPYTAHLFSHRHIGSCFVRELD